MVKIVILAAACLALASASPKVRRDAPAQGSALQDIEKHATEFQKTISEQLNALINSKDSQSLQKALQDGSKSVLDQLTTFGTTLQGALADANGKAKEALETAKANIEKTTEELRKQHPEVEQQANALKERINVAVQSAVDETKKLSQAIAANAEQTNEKLAPKIKEAFNDFVKQSQEVQKKLHEAATKQ